MVIKYDKQTDSYVAYSKDIGGPIVTGKTKEEATNKYNEMLKFHKILTRFLHYINLEKRLN